MTWQQYWMMNRAKALRSGDRMKRVWAQWAYAADIISLEKRNRLLES